MSGIHRPAFNKISILRTVLWVFVIFFMVIIAALSSQSAEQSADLSGDVIRRIAAFIFSPFNSLDAQTQDGIVDTLQFAARKSAHMLLYLALGFFAAAALLTYRLKKRTVTLYILGFCVLYAVSDEIHQAFVPGRGPAATDVLIDALGSLLGILLCFLAHTIIKKIRLRHFGRTFV